MTITKTAVAKVAVVATGLAMAMSMLSFAQFAHAQTACSVGTTDLTIGSTGAAVTCLQQVLIGAGYAIPAGATGYFGMQTQAAVKAWQAAVGITPAAGYFGPISRAQWTGGVSTGGTTSTVPGCVAGAMFSSTTGQACTTTSSTVPGCVAGAMFSSTTGQACSGAGSPSTPTGPLAGTDGSISDINELGSLNNEEVSEGNSGVKVLGAEVEVSNDGDIALKSVKVQFDSTGNTGSDNLDDYIEAVDVWLGSTKIGSADVSEFNEDASGVFTKTITLSNAVIRADETENLYISVDAVNNIDSGDITGDSWDVDILNLRFVDGSGVTTTDDSTGDMPGMDVGISFVSFSTAANTELKISTATDTPESGIVEVDATSDTDGVSLLKGKLKLEGTSDVVLDQFPVTFTVASSTGITDAITANAAGLAMVAGTVTLKIGGNEYSESMSNATEVAWSAGTGLVGTVTFDNLDLSIDGGTTENFEVLADINDVDDTGFVSGDTLKASVTASNRNVMDVENSQGDQLADSNEKSGTATGEAQEFRTNGIVLALVSATAASDNDDAAETGTFTIKFKVTAIGDTVYVSSIAGDATNETVDVGGTTTTANTITRTLANNTDTDKTTVGNYAVEDGTAETFTLTVTVPNGAGGSTGQYRAALSGVLWDTSDDTSPANTYTSNLDEFVTPYVQLSNS